MIREELDRALSVLDDRLPDGDFLVLVRRAFGDRRVVLVRGDVENVAGRSAEALEGPTERWIERVHPDDRTLLRDRLERLPRVDRLRLEYRVRSGGGDVRWIREDLRVSRAGARGTPEVVGILRDVTFERTMRARVARLEKELWRSKRLEAVGAVAGGVAHDFNNLLTVILGSADLLRHEPELAESTREDVRGIREAATRGLELVRKILDFAAREPGRVAPLDPADLVGNLEEILRRVVGARVDLSIDTAGECGPVAVDRAHLEQILLNLASNAGEAMPAGGSLVVRISSETVEEERTLEVGRLDPGRYTRITVEDTGRGIAPEVRTRLFEPFISTKERQQGDRPGGFGLSTVLGVVRRYGGGIRVESELGRGSAFHVYLPEHEQEETKAVSRVRARGGVEAPDAGSARILVVDDDPGVRKVVRRMLEREGHSVATAGSAAEGVRIFDRVRPPFDLLLTDVVLPDRSGHDLWRAVERRVPGLPVVFMSGYDRDTVTGEGVPVPDAQLLAKPVTARTLREAVQAALDRARGADADDELADAEEAGG